MSTNISIGHVGHKWGVIIPKAMRAGLAMGESVVLVREGNNILIRKASVLENTLRNGTQGLAKKARDTKMVAQKLKEAKARPIPMPKRDKFGHFLPAKKKR